MKLRRRAATLLDEVARLAGWLADTLDPPVPPVGPQERAETRARHPAYRDRPETILGTIPVEDAALAEVVPLRPEEPS